MLCGNYHKMIFCFNSNGQKHSCPFSFSLYVSSEGDISKLHPLKLLSRLSCLSPRTLVVQFQNSTNMAWNAQNWSHVIKLMSMLNIWYSSINFSSLGDSNLLWMVFLIFYVSDTSISIPSIIERMLLLLFPCSLAAKWRSRYSSGMLWLHGPGTPKTKPVESVGWRLMAAAPTANFQVTTARWFGVPATMPSTCTASWSGLMRRTPNLIALCAAEIGSSKGK